MASGQSQAVWQWGTLLLLSAGCATPYEAQSKGRGYSDFRVASDIFCVSFRGSAGTREERVEKYVLRRASELTLEHGFRYFVILAEKERTRSSSVGYSAVKIPLVAPGSSIWIQCFHERPSDRALPIDAADFLRFNYPEALETLRPASSESDDHSGNTP